MTSAEAGPGMTRFPQAMDERTNTRVVIIGAGPAGLTAAYELRKSGLDYVVLEKDRVVGGLARTVQYRGNLFDIGGHRFFTKVRAVEDIWHEVLPDLDFPKRKRLSRIYFHKKFFHYPLQATNVLLGLHPLKTVAILMSWARARLQPKRPETTFEDWICNRFGRRLYEMFFKSYTEKVWGIPCSQLSAEWAAQRIKGLSLSTVVKHALRPSHPSEKSEVVKTLIDSFHYPRRGPGMMWQAMAELVTREGQELHLGADVARILWSASRIDAVEISSGESRDVVAGTHFVSSMPIRDFIERLDPPAPASVQAAAARLNYRDFLTVAVVVNVADVFPDNWIYIHDPDVRVGRIQNFKNWSSDMVTDPSKTCLGLEYFCFEGDGLWSASDEELVALATRELGILELAKASDVEGATVVRMPKAYPVYDAEYAEALAEVRRFISELGNIQFVGRNGLHRYNNQDHSMLTAMLAVRNILGENHDLWAVNLDQEYHEDFADSDRVSTADLALAESTQPRTPQRLVAAPKQS